MTTKARRLSIYISPRDTEVLRWIAEQTHDGTSESEAILRLVRKDIRREPSPVEQALRDENARLYALLRAAIARPAAADADGGTLGGALPPDNADIADPLAGWEF